MSVSIDKTRLVELSSVITENLANDEIVAKERHVPIALFDQGVIAPCIDEGIDASSAGDLVVAKSTVECVVEVRSDQTVVASTTVEGDRQEIIHHAASIERIAGPDGGGGNVRITVNLQCIQGT